MKTTDWRAHPLCGPRATLPAQFWGPEQLDSRAFVELAGLLSPDVEIAALLRALGDATDVVDVGGGTGLITQAIARRCPVLVVEPDPEQRAHLPPGIRVEHGIAEELPLAERAADAAVMTWVLQYCADPLRAVDELVRVARRRIVIIQAAPTNELVEVYNREAAVAGLPRAHHGWLLAEAATRLEAAGFSVELEHLPIPVRAPDGGAAALSATLARMHFAAHPQLAEMIAVTTPWIAERLAAAGALADDGVLLRADYLA